MIMLASRDDASILIMYKETVVRKADDEQTAMLTCTNIGFYHAPEMPYTQHLHGALLFIQSEILKDNIHEKDKSSLMNL